MRSRWKMWLAYILISPLVGCSEASQPQTACVLQNSKHQQSGRKSTIDEGFHFDEQSNNEQLPENITSQQENIPETASSEATDELRDYRSDCNSLTNNLKECEEIAEDLKGILRINL